MKQAGALIRVSTSRQLEGTSPEKQLEGVRALAVSQGFAIADVHAWTMAESGNLRERAGFRLALDAIGAGEIGRLYVFSIDRLGRNLLELLLFLRDLEDRDVECWEAQGGRRLRWDDFLVQIEGAVASKERQEIVRRSQDGLRRAISAGKFSGGIIAYGYRLNPVSKQLEIDPEESAVVRLIFDGTVGERLSTVEIADRLNGLGIPTRYAKDGRQIRRGKRAPEHTAGIWRAGRVRNMLKNPAYTGTWEWGKRSSKRPPSDRIVGACPAIVSVETFEAAARVLAVNRWRRERPADRPYLLRGLIRCGDCGLTYVGSASHVAGGKEKRYYRCNGATQWHKLGRAKCPSKSLVAGELEAVVWADIQAFVQRPEVALEQLRAVRAPLDATLGERLAEIDREIRELHRRERNVIRLAAESTQADPRALDDVLGEIRGSLASLEAYQSQLRARLQAGEALERELFGVAERLSRLQQAIDQADFSQRRRAVEELVKGIEVATRVEDGRKTPVVTITYRFDDLGGPPVPTSGLFSGELDRTSELAHVLTGAMEITREWGPGWRDRAIGP